MMYGRRRPSSLNSFSASAVCGSPAYTLTCCGRRFAPLIFASLYKAFGTMIRLRPAATALGLTVKAVVGARDRRRSSRRVIDRGAATIEINGELIWGLDSAMSAPRCAPSYGIMKPNRCGLSRASPVCRRFAAPIG
jgi:hypothetical protein